MLINLLKNKTAIIENDNQPIVTVSPPCAGTVTIQGKTVRVGESLPPLFARRCSLTFTADSGEVYTDNHVMVERNGVVHEHVDISRFVEIMIALDKIDRTLTEHTAQLDRIEGKAKGGIYDLFDNKEDKKNA